MVKGVTDEQSGGFWIRFAAFFIDGLTVWVATMSVVWFARKCLVFPSVELSILVFGLLYWIVLTGWRGQTFGKTACGLRVVSIKGGSIGLWRAALRESVGKLISALPLLLGFLWIGFTKRKRAWHDLLSGTQVQRIPNQTTRRRRVVVALTLLVAVWSAVHTVSWTKLYRIHRTFLDDAGAAAAQVDQHAASAIDETRTGELTAWLSVHGREPRQYLVDFAKKHQVTLVGEIHGKKQFLEYFSDSIVDLYHEAGIRIIALECCRSTQDAQLDRLVKADEYDRELALDIARGAPWRAWGYKEHWDVLESVWRLNQSLPEDAEPLRVVGIFPPVDLISFRLMREGHPLRLFRVLDDLPMLIMHDSFYARHVERQAFDNGKRTLVWVGVNHSWKCCSAQWNAGDKIKRAFRMGAMLHGRYGDQVGTILLHNGYTFPNITESVESSMNDLGTDRLAFDVAESPLASVIATSHLPRSGMNVPLEGYVCGYVVVAPVNHIEPCIWWEDFITPRMFGLYKTYYERLCDRTLKDPDDANRHMQQGKRGI